MVIIDMSHSFVVRLVENRGATVIIYDPFLCHVAILYVYVQNNVCSQDENRLNDIIWSFKLM